MYPHGVQPVFAGLLSAQQTGRHHSSSSLALHTLGHALGQAQAGRKPPGLTRATQARAPRQPSFVHAAAPSLGALAASAAAAAASSAEYV